MTLDERRAAVEASLSRKAVTWWQKAVTWLLSTVIEWIFYIVEKIVVLIFTYIRKELFASPLPHSDLMRGYGIPQKYISVVDNVVREKGVVAGTLWAVAVGIGGFIAFVKQLMDVAGIPMQKEMLALFKPVEPDVREAIVGWHRGWVSWEHLKTIAAKWGYGDVALSILVKNAETLIGSAEILALLRRKKIESSEAISRLKLLGISSETSAKMLGLVETLPEPDVIRSMYLRGLWDDSVHDFKLAQLGYSKETIEAFKKLYMYIPPVSDLVRMAVREAFTPAVIEKYQLHADFPAEFVKWAKQQGVSEEWAKAYWAAHWELPSLLMGYEMLHRGVITLDDLKMLMRVQDIMPFWRDKLIKISYSPFTRVDVRRMFRDNVLNREQVKKAYKDLGYDDWHAEKLTQWTLINAMEEDREASRADVVKAFLRDSISEADARQYLFFLNYSADAIEFFIDDAKYKKQMTLKDQELEYIKVNYVKGSWDLPRTEEALCKLGLPAKEIDYYLLLWTKSTKEKVALPTKAELKRWLIAGTITIERWVEFMRYLGYSDELIAYYADEISAGLTPAS